MFFIEHSKFIGIVYSCRDMASLRKEISNLEMEKEDVIGQYNEILQLEQRHRKKIKGHGKSIKELVSFFRVHGNELKRGKNKSNELRSASRAICLFCA